MNRNRDLKYEIIRVIAMIFVIAIHQIDAVSTKGNILYFFVSLILLTCNPLFFMLSGKFALKFNSEEKDSYKKYYLNKLIKIIIPVFIYMLIKEWYLLKFIFHIPITFSVYLKSLVLSITEGFSSTEYWFIYTLLANLLVVPFTSRIFKNLKKKEMKLFIGIGLLYNTLLSYLKLIDIELQFSYYLAGHNLYFYLGYCIDYFTKTKKDKKIVFTLGIISYILSFIQLHIGKYANIYDFAPTFFFISCMVYVVIRDYVKVNRLKNVILFLGKYSFSIYLVHMMMMDFMTLIFPYNNSVPMFLYIVIKIVMILISSLLLVVIIDNTIIRIIKVITSKILKIRK